MVRDDDGGRGVGLVIDHLPAATKTFVGSPGLAMLLSAPVDADLLDRGARTCSNAIPPDPVWLEGRFDGWLEGDLVADAAGRGIDLLRVDADGGGRAALVRVTADGREATTSFVDFPGGAKTFTIRRDSQTEAAGARPVWWTLASVAAPVDAPRGHPATVRNTLVLMRSDELRARDSRSIVLHDPDAERDRFQYVDWLYAAASTLAMVETMPQVRQITDAAHGHVLTNCGVWSNDSRWIVYDVRSTPDGSVFDGTRIERVDVETGRVEVLYKSRHGATCGVVTCSPADDRVAFILGPEHPTADWSYGAARRQGVVVRAARPGEIELLDARDLVPPFTAGALRGGTHVHVFAPDSAAVSFTYEDAVLEEAAAGAAEKSLRAVGVSVCGIPTAVPRSHPRNHDGSSFTVLVTRLVDDPRPGSDEICKAFEEAWIGTEGYVRRDGSRQRRALAFQGQVVTASGQTISEVFVADLPDDLADLAIAGDGPLTGTATTRPGPPHGVRQRRLTFTADRRHPGLQGPRHWLRSSPDGSRIAFLMRDEAGVVQLFTVNPAGGEPWQLTQGTAAVASAFTWTPDGRAIACVIDGSVGLIDAQTGDVTRLTPPIHDDTAPRPEACVVSPDGRRIAYARCLPGHGGAFNQIFVVDVPR